MQVISKRNQHKGRVILDFEGDIILQYESPTPRLKFKGFRKGSKTRFTLINAIFLGRTGFIARLVREEGYLINNDSFIARWYSVGRKIYFPYRKIKNLLSRR